MCSSPPATEVEDAGREPEVADEPVFERDPALHPLASHIRLCFIFAYRRHHLARTGRPSRFGASLDPRWDGVKDRGGRRHRAIWYDVAELVLAERIDPIELVEAAFWVADDGLFPQPTSLLAPAVVARAGPTGAWPSRVFASPSASRTTTWRCEFLLRRSTPRAATSPRRCIGP